MSAAVERRLPFLVAAIAFLAIGAIAYLCEIKPLPPAFSAGTMTFGIVVAGFAATQRNMLLGMRGSSVLEFAVKTGFHNDVLQYLMHCVYAGLFVSAVSVIGFFINGNGNPLLWWAWFAVLVGAIVLVIALILRNEVLMGRIVKHFIEDKSTNS